MQFWLVLMALFVIGCSDRGEVGEPGLSESSSVAEAVAAVGVLDPMSRAAYIQRARREAGPAYHLQASQARTEFRALNRAQAIELRFTEESMTLVPAAPTRLDDWQVDVRLVSFGRDGAVEPVGRANVSLEGNRIEYRRGSLTEWYINGPLGVEQGFTLNHRPAGDGEAVIVVSLGEGVLAEANPNGQSAVLRTGDDRRVIMRVVDLHAVDADGRVLPTRMVEAGRALQLRVTDDLAQYPVRVDPLFVAEQASLVASDADTNDMAGQALALDGDTAVVGARAEDESCTNCGAAYVFVRSATTWTQQQKLMADDATGNFGFAVALSGDTLFAYGNDIATYQSHTVYVFERVGSTWTEVQQIVGDGGNATNFGMALAIEGDTAVAGASRDQQGPIQPGAAYVYVRDGTAWVEQAKVYATIPLDDAYFGHSVAINGDTIVVGEPQNIISGNGAAYVFERTGTTWQEQAQLLAGDAASGDYFGCSVGVDGDVAVVGAWGDDDMGDASGSAYVFERTGTTWGQRSKLVPSASTTDYRCGGAVAIAGDTIAVGCHRDADDATNGGSVYVFMRSGTEWLEQVRLASDGEHGGGHGDQLGCSIAVDGYTVAAGAFGDDLPGGWDQGSVSVFVVIPTKADGEQCYVAGECISGFCVDNVCCGTACDATCQACSAAAKVSGVDDGVCGLASAGTDPHDDCTDDGAPACGQNGLCDGAGGCAVYAGLGCTPEPCAEAAECTSGFCQDGICCDRACTPAEACTAALKVSGSDGTCGEALTAVPGRACNDGTTCTSGWCVDGVCCDAACDGVCEACTAALKGYGVDGQCEPVMADSDPEDECSADPGYPTNCGADGMCDGAGQCRSYALNTVECAAPICSGNSQQLMLCNGSGQCLNTSPTPCEPYVCSAGACATTCPDDTGCHASAFCTVAGECTAKISNGEACARVGECQSGFCTDGVCCNQPCGGQCEVCNDPSGPGACIPVVGEPRNGRPPCDDGAGDVCAARTCDGLVRAECQGFASTAVICRAAGCSAEGELLPESMCDGWGACSERPAESCAPYVCVSGTCSTDCAEDSECAADAHCEGGQCVEDAGNGTACTEDRECLSGFCVDGHCCNDACVGQCEACDLAGALGTCVPVSGAPHGARNECPSGTADNPCSRAQCDGFERGSCTGFVGTSTPCGTATCADGMATPEGRCDGLGACITGDPVDCGAYRCGETACLTSCTSDNDCAGDSTCDPDTGDCVAAARCGQDGVSIENPNGTTDSCSPFACRDGRCLTTCNSAADCAPAHRCSADGACVAREDDTGSDGGGCGCRAVGSSRTGNLAALGAMLALGLLGWRLKNARPARSRDWKGQAVG